MSSGPQSANSWVPVAGVIGFAVDSLSGAQYRLEPSVLHADLTETRGPEDRNGKSEVFFYNTARKGQLVSLELPNEDKCVLVGGQFTVRHLDRGAVPIALNHLDLFSFNDEYEVPIESAKAYVALFWSIAGTHYALSSGLADGYVESCIREGNAMPPNTSLDEARGNR